MSPSLSGGFFTTGATGTLPLGGIGCLFYFIFLFLEEGLYHLELILLHPIAFRKLCFHFHLSQGIFWFPLWFHHGPFGFLVACCLISMCLFCSLFSFSSWFLVSYCCGQKNAWYNFFLSLYICWGLFCVLVCDLSWRTFYVHLKRMRILLFGDVMPYSYQLSPTGLLYHFHS